MFPKLPGCPYSANPKYEANQIDFDRLYYEAYKGMQQKGGDFKKFPVIIQRECADCKDSHKNIFYKRIADTGNRYFDAYEMFIGSWRDRYKFDGIDPYEFGNKLNADFELYSTLEDALAGKNRWTYCNYNDWVGFPRDCGPTRYVPHQWNGILRGQVRG
jgi:hypothetical protein